MHWEVLLVLLAVVRSALLEEVNDTEKAASDVQMRFRDWFDISSNQKISEDDGVDKLSKKQFDVDVNDL